MNTKHAWEDAYNAAILETDDGKLPLRVREAKAAVDARLCAMYQPHGVSPEELQALSDALAGLNILLRERCPSQSLG